MLTDICTMILTNTTQENILDEFDPETVKPSYLKQQFEAFLPNIIDFGVRVILVLIAFFIGIKLLKFVRKVVSRSLERASVEVGVMQFIDSIIRIVGYIVIALTLLGLFGIDTTSFAAALASAGVAIGLALQGSLSNFAGGILILIMKPFKVGDYIVEHGNGKEGTVKEIQVCYTKLLTIDNKEIIIPNGKLSDSTITNVSIQNKRMLDLRVGISYDSDLKKAKTIIQNIMEQDSARLVSEEMVVFVDELADSSVNLGGRMWVASENYWSAKWRITEAVKLAFDEEGISIPFPQMDVHIQNTKE